MSATHEEEHPGGELVSTTQPNPFGDRPTAAPATVTGDTDAQRAIAEVQAAMIIAQRFPRDQRVSFDRVITAFQRPSLAEHALYAYARGGTEITGPSIRAAEAIAQAWGNIEYGVRELGQRPGESTVEAFAWDKETNVRSSTTFQVKHERHTRQGVTRLLDPRDIYELVANQGSRRVRARILAIIPADVVEAAVAETDKTLRAKVNITPELIVSLAEKFGKLGVPREAVEKRIQRRLDTITPSQVLSLGKIFNSINDGMSAPADWFELEAVKPAEGTATKRTAEKLGAIVEEVQAGAPGADGVTTLLPVLPELKGMPVEEIVDIIRTFANERGVDGEALAAIQKTAIGSASLTPKTGVKILEALQKLPVLTNE